MVGASGNQKSVFFLQEVGKLSIAVGFQKLDQESHIEMRNSVYLFFRLVKDFAGFPRSGNKEFYSITRYS